MTTKGEQIKLNPAHLTIIIVTIGALWTLYSFYDSRIQSDIKELDKKKLDVSVYQAEKESILNMISDVKQMVKENNDLRKEEIKERQQDNINTAALNLVLTNAVESLKDYDKRIRELEKGK